MIDIKNSNSEYNNDFDDNFSQIIEKNIYISKYKLLLEEKYKIELDDENLLEDGKNNFSFEITNINDFFNEFVNYDENNQINMLKKISMAIKNSEIKNKQKFALNSDNIKITLSFIEELIYLMKKNKNAKIYSIPLILDLFNTLSSCHIDDIRYKFFCIVLLLIDFNSNTSSDKNMISKLNKELYESLYDFQNYYENIQNYTMESEILKISDEDAKELIQGYLKNQNLSKSIETSIDKLGGSVFFKIRRSPKDAYSGIVKNSDFDSDIEINEKNFMKINNINQLLQLCKYSDRIKEDVENFEGDKFIILRRWVENIENEFRCFYCNNNLNAVSCYESTWTEQNMDKITKMFNSFEFISKFKSIPYDHAILDVFIEVENLNLKIIEINPFGKVASSAKFSWVLDRDILIDGYNFNGKVIIK